MTIPTAVQETIEANEAAMEEEIQAAAKEASKQAVRSRHHARASQIIKQKGLQDAHSAMMSGKRIGWMESQAWMSAIFEATA